MNLKELKAHYLDAQAQIFIFNQAGSILESCHALVPVHSFLDKSIFTLFHELGSIRLAIQSLRAGEKAIELPAVECNFFGMKGIFDFRIFAHPEKIDRYIWLALNQTEMYEKLRVIQQERNLLKIWKEDQERNKNFDR